MQGNRGWRQLMEDPWQRAILDDPNVAHSRQLGTWFLYRPTQLIVDPEILKTDEGGEALRILEEQGVKPVGAGSSRENGKRASRHRPLEHDAFAARRLGLELWQAPVDTDLETLVRDLRAVAPDVASLNHVQVADPHRIGGSTPPIPWDRPGDIPVSDEDATAKIRVAVIDTGLDPEAGLADVSLPDYEIDDSDGDAVLDPAAGHGTFVTGILRRYVRAEDITVHRALVGAGGVASDLEVAEAILHVAYLGFDLVNLSFGGASQDDAPPTVIARALATLAPGTVVVAAAGNESEKRPHWPAAFKGVYAVASIEPGKGEPWVGAHYTNSGWWIDACAPGTDVESAFVRYDDVVDGTARHFEGGAKWSGTSFATPYVVGLIAQRAYREGISVSEAAYRLIDDPNLDRLPELGTVVLP